MGPVVLAPWLAPRWPEDRLTVCGCFAGRLCVVTRFRWHRLRWLWVLGFCASLGRARRLSSGPQGGLARLALLALQLEEGLPGLLAGLGEPSVPRSGRGWAKLGEGGMLGCVRRRRPTGQLRGGELLVPGPGKRGVGAEDPSRSPGGQWR